MEQAIKLKTEFSTADAEYPTFEKEGGVLTLRYEDWKENRVEIDFGEAVAFKWQECEKLLDNERDDCCYQISNSEWVQAHLRQGLIVAGEGHIHYRFNFNGCGQLEVICIGFTQRT